MPNCIYVYVDMYTHIFTLYAIYSIYNVYPLEYAVQPQNLPPASTISLSSLQDESKQLACP